MANANPTKPAAPAAKPIIASEAHVRQAKALDDVDHLLQHLDGLVLEWHEQQGMVYSIATAGKSFALGDGDTRTIPSDLFATIQQMTESTTYPAQIEAAVIRLRELLRLQEARHG